MDGRIVPVLIDPGCSFTLVGKHFASGLASLSPLGPRDCIGLEIMDCSVLYAKEFVTLSSVKMDGTELGPVRAYVMSRLPLGVSMVLGLDVVLKHGLSIREIGEDVEVIFGGSRPACTRVGGVSVLQPRLDVNDEDFDAEFREGRWMVRWKWNGNSIHDSPAPRRQELVAEADRVEFDAELSQWLDEGILVPHEEAKHGAIRHYLPLIAVRQSKGPISKVRPVLDYRLLNETIQSHPGGSTPICADQLRAWRQMGPNCSIMDLRRAYLQVHIDHSLWIFQALRWKGKDFLLTRLGFGLASAPKIMTKIVESVINANEKLQGSVTSYIDDLYIQEDKVCVEEVKEHFTLWGLNAKPAERLRTEDIRILGLKVDENLDWTRDGKLPDIPKSITRREVHKLVGLWCGHYPVAGWLRPVCGFIQRQAALEGIDWDEQISEKLKSMILDINGRLQGNGDPVCGHWLVDKVAPVTIWADASSLAVGVCIEVEGRVVEDAAWMRPINDTKHINCAELDAVIRGFNIAMKWGRRDIRIFTDSSTVYGWLLAIIRKTHNIRTRSIGEILIRRRLDILVEILKNENLNVDVQWVKSQDNKADRLTRVPTKWLKCDENAASGCVATIHDVRDIHNKCHFGIDKTLQLARERFGNDVSKEIAKTVVRDCEECSRVDPTPRIKYDHGKINSNGVWDKIAVDITHVNSRPYLSIIDVFSGYTIWFDLKDESGVEITRKLRIVFSAFGPPRVIMSDNGAVFRGRDFHDLISEWDVESQLTCSYRSQGNGTIERVHRTIKRSISRSGKPVENIVFWHNNTRGCRKHTPHELLFGMSPRKPGVSCQRYFVTDREAFNHEIEDTDFYEQKQRNPFLVGDKVFLRPPSGRCDVDWSGPHIITDINSNVSVTINEDGISRHVSHLRLVPGSRIDAQSASPIGLDVESSEGSHLRRSTRVKRRPDWWSDYYVEV